MRHVVTDRSSMCRRWQEVCVVRPPGSHPITTWCQLPAGDQPVAVWWFFDLAAVRRTSHRTSSSRCRNSCCDLADEPFCKYYSKATLLRHYIEFFSWSYASLGAGLGRVWGRCDEQKLLAFLGFRNAYSRISETRFKLLQWTMSVEFGSANHWAFFVCGLNAVWRRSAIVRGK